MCHFLFHFFPPSTSDLWMLLFTLKNWIPEGKVSSPFFLHLLARACPTEESNFSMSESQNVGNVLAALKTILHYLSQTPLLQAEYLLPPQGRRHKNSIQCH